MLLNTPLIPSLQVRTHAVQTFMLFVCVCVCSAHALRTHIRVHCICVWFHISGPLLTQASSLILSQTVICGAQQSLHSSGVKPQVYWRGQQWFYRFNHKCNFTGVFCCRFKDLKRLLTVFCKPENIFFQNMSTPTFWKHCGIPHIFCLGPLTFVLL